MDRVALERIVGEIAAGEPTVLAAWIFGSRADGSARATSDLDVAYAMLPGLRPDGGLANRLCSAIARETLLDVDVVQLSDQHPVLGIEIVGHGCRVFVRDEEDADDLEERVRRRYLDTAHMRRVQNHYLYGDPL